MPYTNADTNMTSSAGLTPGMQTYYNRELLRTFEPELVHLQFGDEHRMPENNGLIMNMRKLFLKLFKSSPVSPAIKSI